MPMLKMRLGTKSTRVVQVDDCSVIKVEKAPMDMQANTTK